MMIPLLSSAPLHWPTPGKNSLTSPRSRVRLAEGSGSVKMGSDSTSVSPAVDAGSAPAQPANCKVEINNPFATNFLIDSMVYLPRLNRATPPFGRHRSREQLLCHVLVEPRRAPRQPPRPESAGSRLPCTRVCSRGH